MYITTGMNTVLDDNRTLCLPNGERIKLNGDTMRTLFESGLVNTPRTGTPYICVHVRILPISVLSSVLELF